ncbi:MAG: hypothetical protein SOY63_06805 [Alloprevotella sp.]|nr:hypothetical protein [Alloprevotella sp.]
MKNNIGSPMINLVNHQCQADFANTTHIAAPSAGRRADRITNLQNVSLHQIMPTRWNLSLLTITSATYIVYFGH